MSHTAHSSTETHTWHPKGGVTLLDRYQILGVIGQGGMGTVYKGFHLSLKRFVAIKVLRVDQGASIELVNRFMREMEAVGQMDHPNVVRAADAGKINGVFYLVMEHLDGSDLSHLVAVRGRLDTADACELARQTAVGLDYIHQRLVHRDIKPSNLILTTSGLVKILDLGLARLHEVGAGKECTPSGSALGTYDYLAPEQAAASRGVDGRADIYSLGCTLFKLLTGQPPFSGPDYEAPAKKLFAHAHTPLTAVAEFQSVPEALRPVLLKMTAKDPAERYQSAREVAEVLAPFVAESQPLRLLQSAGAAVAPALRPLPARLPSDMELLTASPHETPVHIRGAPEFHTAPPPARRRRSLVIGAAVVLVCALGAAAWFLAPMLLDRLADGRRQASAAPVLPEEVSLPPPPAPLVTLDQLPRLSMTNLLDANAPPTVVGFRQGDGRATGHWIPGRQQLEVNPTSPVLMLLAADNRQAPSYTFEVLMEQRPWAGDIGLFWGYQEDAAAKAARQPGQEFARCQALLLQRVPDPGGGARCCVDRCSLRLQFGPAGDVVYVRVNKSHDNLPLFSGEQLFQIVIDGGQLTRARFGDADLTTVRGFDTNNLFQSTDYRGGFGAISIASNMTIRRPRVMPHADN